MDLHHKRDKSCKVVIYGTQCATFWSIACNISITPLPKECTLQHVVWLTLTTYGAVAVLILWWAETHKVKADKNYHPAMMPTQQPMVTKYSWPVSPGRGMLYTNPLWIHWAWLSRLNLPGVKEPNCHDHDTQSTLYHSIRSHPCVYHLFHCMYLCFLIVSILLVSPLIGEHFVQSIFPYDYLICFHLRFWLLSVPVPLYLLITY